MNMKKNVLLIIAAIMIMTLAGCGKTEKHVEKENTAVTAPEEEPVEEEPVVEEPVVEEPVVEESEAENGAEIRTELTEATQHQISAFIGSINNYYSEEPFPSSTTNAEDCMVLLKYYLNDCGFDFQEGNKDDLPFAWKEYHINRAEFDLFFEKGWGIEIPEDFSYTAFNDYIPELPYGVLIPEEGGWESNVDGSLYLSGGRTVEIEGYADGVYTLKGTFVNGASDDDSLTQKTFTATAIESGEPQIYDGLQITGFNIIE